MLNSDQVFEYSTIPSLHIHNRLIQFVILILTKKGSTYTSQYLCKHVGIRVNLSRARICASREHNFGLSLLSFDSA